MASNRFVIIHRQHSDFITVVSDVSGALSEGPIDVFVRTRDKVHCQVEIFYLDREGLSFELPSEVCPEGMLRPFLSWSFLGDCEEGKLSILFRLPNPGGDL